MLKFTKDGAVKIIDPESKLIPILEKDGWEVEGKKSVVKPEGKKSA